MVLLQVALAQSNGLDLGTTLIITGLYNLASGALFGIPMPVQVREQLPATRFACTPSFAPTAAASESDGRCPVQPMKSIAAIALSENPLTVPQIVAAGMGVSAVVLLLGATRLINYFNRVVRMMPFSRHRNANPSSPLWMLLNAGRGHRRRIRQLLKAANGCASLRSLSPIRMPPGGCLAGSRLRGARDAAGAGAEAGHQGP